MSKGTVVTCMGESLIDFVPLNAPGQSESAFGTGKSKPEDQAEVLPKGSMSTDFRMYPGGSIFNVVVGLAYLGQHAAFAGKIAEDYFGHHLLLTLNAEGVDTCFVTTAKAQTALAFVAIEEEESLQHFCGLGPALAIVTHGEKGVLARSSSSDTLQIPIFPVPVIDTVGAGVLAWLADRMVLVQRDMI